MKKLRTASFDILGLTFRSGTPARARIGWLVFVRWLPGVSEPERKNLTFLFPGGFESNVFR